MKNREPKVKLNSESNAIITIKCPACLSGLEPTIVADDFSGALRESL